jgi:hypothetical protein
MKNAITPEVGLFANNYLYTDVSPYEITKVISAKTIEIRRMGATLVDGWKPDMIVGGFSAHTTNNSSQEYNYTSLPGAKTTRARLRKDGRWYSNQGRHSIALEPRKFHDYNF